MKKQRWVNVLFLFPTVAAFILVIIVPFFLGIFLFPDELERRQDFL